MSFLQPLFLLALLLLPIIVLLHLLRERRRLLVVPSLQHWLNLPQRPGGQSVRRLPLTLLLLLHLLVAALFALALGRPRLLLPADEETLQTALIIDTSSSMAAVSGGSTRFVQAQ